MIRVGQFPRFHRVHQQKLDRPIVPLNDGQIAGPHHNPVAPWRDSFLELRLKLSPSRNFPSSGVPATSQSIFDSQTKLS